MDQNSSLNKELSDLINQKGSLSKAVNDMQEKIRELQEENVTDVSQDTKYSNIRSLIRKIDTDGLHCHMEEVAQILDLPPEYVSEENDMYLWELQKTRELKQDQSIGKPDYELLKTHFG